MKIIKRRSTMRNNMMYRSMIKVSKTGQITLSKKLCKTLELDEDDKVYFTYDNKGIYICYTAEPDGFTVKKKLGELTMRCTSKDTQAHIESFFNVHITKSTYICVSNKPTIHSNNKYYKLTSIIDPNKWLEVST